MSDQTPTIERLAQDTRTFEEKVKDFGMNAISIAPLICAIGIAIWWVFFGMVEIVPTSLTISERIGLTGCTVFLAVTYCKLISVGGFKSAKSTKTWKAITDEWSKAISKGNTSKREIVEYAKDIAKGNQKDIRIENLEKNGINYYEIFDDSGNVINFEYYKNKYRRYKNPIGYRKHQIKVIRKCITMRVEIPEMFGNLSSKFFGIKKRETQKAFSRKTDITSTIIRLIIAIFSVGLMFNWIGTTPGALVYALFQIVLWTGSGILQRINNFNFVVNELQPQIVENTLVITGYLELDESKKAIYQKRVLEEQEKRHRLLITMQDEKERPTE